MTVRTADYARVPGVAECRLDDTVAAALPPNEAPAPWECALGAIAWWARGGRAAARSAEPVTAGRRPLGVVGGFVTYESTPVGRYSEVFGAIGFRDGRRVAATIPFMSVDSPASLVGGRGNWSLPKCPARFAGEPGETSMSAEGDGWTVRAAARPFGPEVPVRLAGTLLQQWPDGVVRAARLRGRGRARAAVVTVDVRSTGQLASWLRPGRHLGAVLSQTRFTLSEAR